MIQLSVTNSTSGVGVSASTGRLKFQILYYDSSGTYLGEFYFTDENNDLTPNRAQIAIVRDAVDKLKAAGVENFLAMASAFVYPSDYPTTTNYVVPDPYEEYDTYIE